MGADMMTTRNSLALVGLTAILASTSACVLGEQVTRPYDPASADRPAAQGRFQQLTTVANPGFGVVPNRDGLTTSAWLGMGDRVCAMSGSSGAITVDIFVDGDVAPGVVLLDVDDGGFLAVGPDGDILVTDGSGQVLDDYPLDIDGDVLAGQLTDDGILVLVATDDGCFVVRILPDGTQEIVQVDDEVCEPATDLVDTDGGIDGIVVGGGDQLIQVGDAGVIAVDDGDQGAYDTQTGRFYAATTGEDVIRVHGPDRVAGALSTEAVMELPLPGPLVDFDVSNGQLVALTTDHDLIHLDALTGETLAVEPYFGPLGMHRVQFTTDDTRGLVISSDRDLQFYALRPNRSPAGGPPDAEAPGPAESSPGTAQ